ncbi:MAG: hypothetical protein K9H14_07405 [Actinomycetia bacterium]|nr:hypothetical protein [Actinomycetes bacterium]
MSKVWLDAFLGRIGNYILDFIQDYYLVIVPLLAVYGIFLAISAYNFKRIEKRVNQEIILQAKKIIDEAPGISYISLVEKVKIPWVDIVYRYSFFPYVSQEADLWASRTMVQTVRKMIMANNNKIKLVLRRAGIAFVDTDQEIRKNIYLDYIQRITQRRQ